VVRTNTKIVSNRIFFNEKFKLTGLNVFRNKDAALISLIEYKDGIEKINTTRRPMKKMFR
jgi:hypothetical protein